MSAPIESPAPQPDYLFNLAERALGFFESTSTAALEELKESRPNAENVFASANTFIDEAPSRALGSVNAERESALRILAKEPAIARVVVEADDGKRMVYYIAGATPPRSPTDGSAIVNRYGRLGRLGSIKI